MTSASLLWRLGITGIVSVVLLILVVNLITQPVAPDVRSYTAEFTDASGLYPGADVRIRGVRVGKVQSVALERDLGQSVAAVGFTLERRFGVVSATRLAIKYQSLTGARYVDVVNPSESNSPADLVTRISTAMTQPSFDITALFNGLQPVLATISPDAINTFATNAANFLAGDGSGLAPTLESMRTLSKFVSDRQQVIAILMRNLSAVAESLGGHAKDAVQLLKWVNRPLDGTLSVLDEFRKSELYGPDFVNPVAQLLAYAGLPWQGNSGSFFTDQPPGSPDPNVTNIDTGLDRAITAMGDFADAFKLVPFMWENIGPPFHAGAPLPCSHGRFQLPEQMDVLLNGQRVVLCKR